MFHELLSLYNTYTKKKELFRPLHKKVVSIYTCGPTVYDYAHIGNFRSFIVADVLNRYLNYSGYKVKHAKNITDVGHLTQDDIEKGEDKIITSAKKKKMSPKDIAEYFTRAFFEDEKKLNIKKLDYYPKATKYVKKMINAIKLLIKSGYAYEKEGSVFFDVTKFKNYGKLSGNTMEELKKEARLEANLLKKHWFDFSLWLKAPKDHLMQWKSPWSNGYPGWHIECSVMSTDKLGNTIDIHTGGEDNVFPHHENEIAQSEALLGKKFVRFWIHVRHLLVNGKKMSKSEGNFYVLRDIEKRGFSPIDFRLLILGTHYKNQMNFTWQALQDARNALDGLRGDINRLYERTPLVPSKDRKVFIVKDVSKLIKPLKKYFEKHMNNDLNTPRALSVLFDFINDTKGITDKKEVKKAYEFIQEMDSVLGLNLKYQKQVIPQKIKNLAKKREKLRKEKKWEEADKIRNAIYELGYIMEDTKLEMKIKKK